MLTFMFGMYYINLDNILVKNMICLLINNIISHTVSLMKAIP